MTKVEVTMQERKTRNAPLPSPEPLGTFLLEIGTALVIFAAVISLFAAIFR